MASFSKESQLSCQSFSSWCFYFSDTATRRTTRTTWATGAATVCRSVHL